MAGSSYSHVARSGNSTFTVTSPDEPRIVVDPAISRISDELANDAAQRSPVGPTGDLRAGWRKVPGNGPSSYRVVNTVRYAKYVEYGTRRTRAQPMIGPALQVAQARYR